MSSQSPVKSVPLGKRGFGRQGYLLSSSKGLFSPQQKVANLELDADPHRDFSPQRQQPERPQRWETSTKFNKANR